MAKMWKECLWCKEKYNPDETNSLFCSKLCFDCHDTWYFFIVIVLSIDDCTFDGTASELECF